MTKFHLGKNGEPATCTASKKSCPLGGENDHFDNKADASREAERRFAEEAGGAFIAASHKRLEEGQARKEKRDAESKPVLTEDEADRVSDYIYYGSYGVSRKDEGFGSPAGGSNSYGGHSLEGFEISDTGEVNVYLNPTEEGLNGEDSGLDVHMDENDYNDLTEAQIHTKAETIADDLNREYTDNVVSSELFESNGAADEVREAYAEAREDVANAPETINILPRGIAENVSSQDVIDHWEANQEN